MFNSMNKAGSHVMTVNDADQKQVTLETWTIRPEIHFKDDWAFIMQPQTALSIIP